MNENELKEIEKNELKEMKKYKYLCKKLDLKFNLINIETLDYYLYMNDNNLKETIKHYKNDYY